MTAAATEFAATEPILVPVVRDQKIRSWPKCPIGGEAKYTALAFALTHEYVTDAHFAAYSVPSHPRRLGTDALLKPGARSELDPGVAMKLAIFDVDCPAGHKGDAHATDAWWLDEIEKLAALFNAHPNGFAYRTRGGYRIVYWLTESIVLRDGADAESWSLRYCAWLVYLTREFEILADAACKDWTRLFRLPHATRDEGGRPERRETIGDVESIGEWTCEPSTEDQRAAKTLCRKRARKEAARDSTTMGPTVPAAEGILIRLFARRAWLGDEIEPGKWNARCPNESAHTKGSPFDGSTVLYSPNPGESFGWLHCSHAHCLERTLRDALAAFPEAEVRALLAPMRAPSSAVDSSPDPAPESGDDDASRPAARGRRPEGRATSFSRGDHPELGEFVLDQLADDRGQLIHSEGKMHRYDSRSGLWVPVDVASLRCLVANAAGAATDKGPLKIKSADAAGAILFASASVDCRDFFTDAPRGVHFKNVFFAISDDGALVERAHSPGNRARSGIELDLPSAAECPRWKAFLAETFEGDADAAEKIACVQEIGGAAILGIAPRFQKDVIFLGDGANGKSVVIDVLQGCMPPDTTCSIPPQDWGEQYRLALMAGKHLNVVSELPEADILASGTFKAVITGDQMTARPIRQDPFTFRPRAAHVFATNLMPRTQDFSHGFWRRHIVIRFNHVVDEARQDRDLAGAILKVELPGLVRWLLDGAARLVKANRYTIPTSSKGELDKWKKQSDHARVFLEECTIRVDDARKGTPAGTLYRSFKKWGEDNGHRNLPPSNIFGERMRLLGCPSQHLRRGNFYPVQMACGDPAPADATDGDGDVDSGGIRDEREGREGPAQNSPPACARARRESFQGPSRPSHPSPSSGETGGEGTADAGGAPVRWRCANCAGGDDWLTRVNGDRRCRTCHPPGPEAEAVS